MDKPSTQESVLPHPLLKAVISSLDLQQDEEIARYQRQRHQRSTSLLSPHALATDVPEDLLTTRSANSGESSLPQAEVSQMTGRTQVLEMVATSHPTDTDSSSEFDEPQSGVTPHDSRPKQFTPLGISAVLLFVAASALLATALLIPELRPFNFAKLFNREPVPAPKASEPEAPKLNANERSSVRSLSPSAPPPVPAAPVEPQPEVQSPYPDLTSALLPPSLRPQGGSSGAPAPAPILKQSQPPDVPIARVRANYYYVLAQYTGGFSLKAAQEAVPDANLARFAEGVRIQMGAFQQPEPAHQLVEKLKTLGIAAAVYRAE